MSAFNNCPNCKVANPINANFCRHCGMKLAENPYIRDFHVHPICHVGDTLQVQWTIDNAEKVTINGLDVTNKKGCSFKITDKTKLVIVATNGDRKTSRTIDIIPLPSVIPGITPDNPKIINRNKKIHSALFLYIAIVSIFLLLLYCFWYRTQLVHHYIRVSYNEWNTILMTARILLCVGLSLSIILLIKSILKSLKNK